MRLIYHDEANQPRFQPLQRFKWHRDLHHTTFWLNRGIIKFMSKSSSLSSKPTLRRQPQQKRGQQRVEKILVAAAEVFAEAGFVAATIQQIADRANTAVGSIYQ